MAKFKIGDRVRLIDNEETYQNVGAIGVVRRLAGEAIGVEWDVYRPAQHDLSYACPEGYGWWVVEYHLELEEPVSGIIDEDTLLSLSASLDKLAKAIDNGRLQANTMKKIIDVIKEIG